jgi:hypothetical protein
VKEQLQARPRGFSKPQAVQVLEGRTSFRLPELVLVPEKFYFVISSCCLFDAF